MTRSPAGREGVVSAFGLASLAAMRLSPADTAVSHIRHVNDFAIAVLNLSRIRAVVGRGFR